MPAPLRLRTQRDYVVSFGERLQARGVSGERKFAIADGKAGARIERSHCRVVTPYQSGTIDAAVAALRDTERCRRS